MLVPPFRVPINLAYSTKARENERRSLQGAKNRDWSPGNSFLHPTSYAWSNFTRLICCIISQEGMACSLIYSVGIPFHPFRSTFHRENNLDSLSRRVKQICKGRKGAWEPKLDNPWISSHTLAILWIRWLCGFRCCFWLKENFILDWPGNIQ